jgi:hypothetical protein
VPTDEELGFPSVGDDRELLLGWLRYLRGAVLRNLEGLEDEQARWTPNAKLIPLIGIVNHLTNVECRWIDGGFLGAVVSRRESEFRPGRDLLLDDRGPRAGALHDGQHFIQVAPRQR